MSNMELPSQPSLRHKGETDDEYRERRQEAKDSLVDLRVSGLRIAFLKGDPEAVALFDQKMKQAIKSQRIATQTVQNLPPNDDDLTERQEQIVFETLKDDSDMELYDRDLSTSPIEFLEDVELDVELAIAVSMPKDPHPTLTL